MKRGSGPPVNGSRPSLRIRLDRPIGLPLPLPTGRVASDRAGPQGPGRRAERRRAWASAPWRRPVTASRPTARRDSAPGAQRPRPQRPRPQRPRPQRPRPQRPDTGSGPRGRATARADSAGRRGRVTSRQRDEQQRLSVDDGVGSQRRFTASVTASGHGVGPTGPPPQGDIAGSRPGRATRAPNRTRPPCSVRCCWLPRLGSLPAGGVGGESTKVGQPTGLTRDVAGKAPGSFLDAPSARHRARGGTEPASPAAGRSGGPAPAAGRSEAGAGRLSPRPIAARGCSHAAPAHRAAFTPAPTAEPTSHRAGPGNSQRPSARRRLIPPHRG